MLLAEDNLINQTVAKKMLTVLGLVCEVACNGQEGVDAVKRGAADGRPFDCVLMDMAMPIMGGVEAARVSHFLLLFSITLQETSLLFYRIPKGALPQGRFQLQGQLSIPTSSCS